MGWKNMSIVVVLSIFHFHLTAIFSMDHPQSHIVLMGQGYSFEPISDGDWLDDLIIDSFENCAKKCNLDSSCRTFDYDSGSNHCHLYQVEPSENQIIQGSSNTQLGYIRLTSDLYLSLNKTCQFCENDRYLICFQGYCRCPWNTFWTGSICQKQFYAAERCFGTDQCRDNPYQLTCNSVQICSAKTEDFPPQICSQNRTLIALNTTSGTYLPYYQTNIFFKANTTSITITFSFLDYFAHWLLDDVSLIDLNQTRTVIKNGDFEGNLTDWNYCNPDNNSNSSGVIPTGSLNSKSGYSLYAARPRPKVDYLSQTISTVIGHFYQLSFWLSHSSNSTNNSAIVTIVS